MRGALGLCGGLDALKIDKTQLIYSVGAWSLVWGDKPPVATGLSNASVYLYRSLKFLTDDQVSSQRFNSKHVILSSAIHDLIR